jgi:hypothetical protein
MKPISPMSAARVYSSTPRTCNHGLHGFCCSQEHVAHFFEPLSHGPPSLPAEGCASCKCTCLPKVAGYIVPISSRISCGTSSRRSYGISSRISCGISSRISYGASSRHRPESLAGFSYGLSLREAKEL